MYFKEVSLENFRNYDKETVSFDPHVNIITGNNAQGKTNLLESLYIMSIGKSFRTNRDIELIGFQKDFCIAKACYEAEGRQNEIEIIITKEGKSIKINGLKLHKYSELLDHVYIVIFSPEDLKIIKDEPEKRRRFIDRELSQLKPVYYKNLASYKKTLIQRNTLLKQGVNDESLLDVWDRALVEYGCRIIIERSKFIEKLNNISNDIHIKITNGKEQLKLEYESDIPFDIEEKDLFKTFYEIILKNRRRDIKRGITTTGPHKDDLRVCINGIDIRHYGSQGQQRTAALSLKLAELRLIREEKNEEAILLLDDVLSELDEERQLFLIDSLSDVQLFITATELPDSIMKTMTDGKVYLVDKGRVEKQFDKKLLSLYNHKAKI